MPDPTFIRAMTRWYEDMLRQNETENVPQPHEEESRVRSIDTLTSIMTTRNLVQILNNQLSAGNYGILCITGMQGSGKSSVARTAAHIMHTELGYKLIYVSGYDVLEAPERLVAEAGESKKIFVVIDDASYVFNSVAGVQANRVKQFFGIIRHALAGAQVCLAVITHVQAGVPPILRNSNAWLFSAPTLQEFDTMGKLTGKNDAAKEAFGAVFNSVTKIQAMAAKSRDLNLTFGKYTYPFKWGTKDDKGDGRLMIAIIAGKAHVYRSQEEYCDECKAIGNSVKFNPANYMGKKTFDTHEHKQEGTA